MTVSITDQLASARRELKLRRRVYPQWVATGRLRQDTADHEIACMEAIVATLEGLAPKEPTQGALL